MHGEHRQRQWHKIESKQNKQFRDKAREFGLIVESNGVTEYVLEMNSANEPSWYGSDFASTCSG